MKVNSEARFPIKMWTDYVPVEDCAMQQLKNIANMPFIYKHIAVLPDVHLGIGATVGSVIATKGAICPASVGVDIGCFVGETKIPLLDGTQDTLKNLSERSEPFWVYSVDKNLQIAPGKAVCKKTRSSAELMKIVVSGGDEIICTPDHEFMLPNGSYKRADKLKFNESLMPLYRSWQTRDGYESCSNGRGNKELTHIWVWEYINGRNVPDGHVIHHDNHCHFNNSPENLIIMTTEDHSSYHRRVGRKFDNSSVEFQKLRRVGIEKSKSDKAITEKRVKVGTQNITDYMKNRPEHFSVSVAGNGKRGAPYLDKLNRSPKKCYECDEVFPNFSAYNWHKRKTHVQIENHKVISVEMLDYCEDVYCLQVETHHNFALSAGVFVHNCGMMAVKTNLMASDLPDNLHAIRCDIEKAVPHGRTNNGGVGDRGAWNDVSDGLGNTWNALFEDKYKAIIEKHPKAKAFNTTNHLGTLGGGNHFVEVCLDTEQTVWIMLHSGSRGLGNKIGSYFIERAQNECERYFISLPDKDLAYLVEGTDLFDDYVEAVEMAQGFAATNRAVMMGNTLRAIRKHIPHLLVIDHAVNCHHNYVSKENHFGENVIVTRKGAVRARKTDLGIIPGSMGAKSFIVRGLGNEQSFCSCSHGAGRVMSRGQAKKEISLADHIKDTAGVECRKDVDVIDESPRAYKRIEDVMKSQEDLVEIVATLKQILCVKG